MIYLNPELPDLIFFLDRQFSIFSLNTTSGSIDRFYTCSPITAGRDYGESDDLLYFFDKDRGISGGFYNSSELIFRRIDQN